jgi:uncharacterized membrane protein
MEITVAGCTASTERKMKHRHAPASAIGIGVVAGLRPMTALAVIASALRRGWVRPGQSPFARIVSASTSKRIAEFAISELGCGQVAFHAPSLGCCTARVTYCVGRNLRSRDICGTVKGPVVEGAVLGGLGSLAGPLQDTTFVRDSVVTCLTLWLRSLRMH